MQIVMEKKALTRTLMMMRRKRTRKAATTMTNPKELKAETSRRVVIYLTLLMTRNQTVLRMTKWTWIKKGMLRRMRGSLRGWYDRACNVKKVDIMVIYCRW